MKFTLPKSRIIPLVFLAIIGTLLSLMLGLYYMGRMAQFSYKTTLDSYESLTDNTAMILKKNIESDFQSLQVSANLVGQIDNLGKEQIMTMLPLLADNKSYIDLAIVLTDGKGYNIDGNEVDVSDEVYFDAAIHGLKSVSDHLVNSKDNEPAVIYTVPIYNNGSSIGVLLATISACINPEAYMDNANLDDTTVYILNQNKDLVFFFDENKTTNISHITNFNYEQVISKGYMHEVYENQISNLDMINFLLKYLNNEKEYIWHQSDLGMNGWTLLVGNYDVLDPIAQQILKISSIMWTFLIIGIFLLFMLLIIFQRKSNRKVIQTLYLDPVTGGGNWYKFRLEVNKILNSRQFSKKRYALINFDINRFKIINDAYGYQKGDEVLKDIYMVLKKWVKPGEPFTRYAADQFYILMSFHQEQEVTSRLNELNDRLRQLRYTKTVKIFFGVFYITERKDSIDRMGDFAGIAKNRSKESNEGMISFFDDKARGRLLEEEEIEKNMYEALRNDEFIMYLQPKYKAKEETVSGAEALVRWRNNKGNLITPGYFIPVFEKNGFIIELDLYMLRKVCRQLRDWLNRGYHPLPISVNISRIHFVNPALAENIKNIVDEYGIPHELIELELTESAFLQSKSTLIKTVIELKKFGFLVSMDDFGAGYSSLNSLKDLPLDIVKLDGELFRITEEVERGFTVIRNTISMAKDLHMKVVAECIETREQVEFLCTVGCDIIQGYYFAKPMPTDQFEQEYLRGHNN
ncbi:MAG: putative signaling protein [Herbinix sp.]|nr:putative signaling protein [Herbinix sp.]